MAVKLYHPDATSCSFDGKSYARAVDGSFDVPQEVVAALVESHGFLPQPPAPSPDPLKAKGKKPKDE